MAGRFTIMEIWAIRYICSCVAPSEQMATEAVPSLTAENLSFSGGPANFQLPCCGSLPSLFPSRSLVFFR